MFKYLWIVALAILYAIWAVISIIDIIVSLRDKEEFLFLSTEWFIAIHIALPFLVSLGLWLFS